MKARTAIVGAVCAAVFGAIPASAAPDVAIAFRHEPAAVAVAVDPQGRAFTVANEERPDRTRAVVRAYTAGGRLRWERTWAPAGGSVFALAIAASDGIVVITGRVAPTDPAGPCDDVWAYGWIVAAWRTDGTGLWHRGEAGWRTCEVFATTGSAVAIGGTTVAVAASYADEYGGFFDLLSLDRQGGHRWIRRVEVPGSDDERPGGVAVGSKGAIYVAAQRNAPFLDSDEHDGDAMLARYDADGRLAWMRTVPEGPLGAGDDRDRGTSVALIPGGVVLGAVMDEPSGPSTARVALYGWDGALRWERRFPGAYPTWETVKVARWAEGAVLAGTEPDADGHGTHLVLRGLGSNGDVLWRRNLGPHDDRTWRMISLGAGDGRIAVIGQPASAYGWSRVWLLDG